MSWHVVMGMGKESWHVMACSHGDEAPLPTEQYHWMQTTTQHLYLQSSISGCRLQPSTFTYRAVSLDVDYNPAPLPFINGNVNVRHFYPLRAPTPKHDSITLNRISKQNVCRGTFSRSPGPSSRTPSCFICTHIINHDDDDNARVPRL